MSYTDKMHKIISSIVAGLVLLFFLTWTLLAYMDSRRLPAWIQKSPLKTVLKPSVTIEKQIITQAGEHTPQNLTFLIRNTARRYNLDPAFLMAIAKINSNFDPYARDPNVKAAGLLLLRNEPARIYAAKNIFLPEENLTAGAAYLRDLLIQVKGDLEIAALVFRFGKDRLAKPEFSEALDNYLEQFRIWYAQYRLEESDHAEVPLVLIKNSVS